MNPLADILMKESLTVEGIEKALVEAHAIAQRQPQSRQERSNGRVWHYDIEQGSEDWLKLRMGKVTASAAPNLMTSSLTTTGKPAAGSEGTLCKSAVTYCHKKAAERHMFAFDEGYKSKSMLWGNAMEDYALMKYSELTGKTVLRVGFVQFGDFVGCSPDAYVPNSRLIQVKCPEGPTHYKYLKNNIDLVEDYNDQIQYEMWCCGYKKCDLISYHPYFKDPANQLVVVTVEADAQWQHRFMSQLEAALDLINSLA